MQNDLSAHAKAVGLLVALIFSKYVATHDSGN